MRAICGISRFAVAGLCLALVCVSNAFAFPVTWTLSGATFSDNGTATGSFVYDADTNTLSNWSVSVAGGNTTTFPPITYNTTSGLSTITGQGATTTGVQLCITSTSCGDNGGRELRMPTVSPLTNTGGTLAIDLTNIFQGECFNCSPYRPFTAGNLIGVPVPPLPPVAPTPALDPWAALLLAMTLLATSLVLVRRHIG